MSKVDDFEYSELWIKLAKVEAENERLQTELKEAKSHIQYLMYILGRKQPAGGSFVGGQPPRA